MKEKTTVTFTEAVNSKFISSMMEDVKKLSHQ